MTEPVPPPGFRERTEQETLLTIALGEAIADTVANIPDPRIREIGSHVVEVGYALAHMMTQSTPNQLQTSGWREWFEHVCDEHAYAALLLLTRDLPTGHPGEVMALARALATLQALDVTARR